MNTPRPLTADVVDELLSAELDGEFDAAARDLGFEPGGARAGLATYPGVDARRAALARARDTLAELPEIHELMAQRLRSKATRAAEQAGRERRARRTRRWQRALAVSGVVAAAAAVVVGVVATSRRSESTKSASAPASGAPANAGGARPGPSALSGAQQATTPIDLGRVPDVETLAARVAAAVPPSAKSPENSSRKAKADYNTSASSADAVAGCDTAARAFAGVRTAATLTAVATLDGARVSVEVFRKEATAILVVVTADCRLVNLRTIASG